MTDLPTEERPLRASEVVLPAPVDAPSENYLVAEQLQRMPSLFSRGVLYLVLLLVAAAAVYISVSKIDLVVESRGVVLPTSHKVKVLSDRDGYIEEVFISEGQSVERGSPLFLVRSKEALTHRARVEELRAAIPLKGDYYTTKMAALNDELKRLGDEHEKTSSIRRLKKEQNLLSLRSVESDLAFYRNEIGNLAKEYDDVKTLFDRRLISIAEYNSVRSRLERASAEMEKLASQRDILVRENKILEEQLEEGRLGHESRKAILEKEVRQLGLEMESTLTSMRADLEMSAKMLAIKDGPGARESGQGEKGDLLVADREGVVSELYFRNRGEFVRVSDLLCTILPGDSPFYTDITVANKDIGFIEQGMEIRYKFDAFPYTDYGTVQGRVSAISPSAVEDKALGFVYHLSGTLDRTHFGVKEKRYPIKAGMTATAEVVTERKSIFSLLFRKLRE